MNAPHPRRPAPAALLPVLLCLLASLVGFAPAMADQAETRKGLRVYAYTFKYHSAQDALSQVRNKLSPFGTVEEQPATNTLVIRDIPVNVDRLIPFLKELDLPPEELRFDIRIVRAGPKADGEIVEAELPAEMANKLRRLLRYDDYRVLAQAGVTSREGEEVTYALGEGYSVSFSPGSLVAGQDQTGGRLKLRNFRVLKEVPTTSDKGRRLEPRKLFHATLNLWVDRPFNLVLTQDDERQEALMVVISCQREGETGQ